MVLKADKEADEAMSLKINRQLRMRRLQIVVGIRPSFGPIGPKLHYAKVSADHHPIAITGWGLLYLLSPYASSATSSGPDIALQNLFYL